MVKGWKTTMAAASLMAAFGAAHATPVLLGSVAKDYGTGVGQFAYNTAGQCDTLNANSLTVRNTTGCQRYVDVFDFSSLSFDSIAFFELEISYNQTNASIFGVPTEQWRIRPAVGALTAQGTDRNNADQNLARVGASQIASVFMLDSLNMGTTVGGQDVFDTVVANQSFYLWFNHTGFGTQNFNLFSAELRVFGVEAQSNDIPAPGTLALVGLGFLAASVAARRWRNRV